MRRTKVPAAASASFPGAPFASGKHEPSLLEAAALVEALGIVVARHQSHDNLGYALKLELGIDLVEQPGTEPRASRAGRDQDRLDLGDRRGDPPRVNAWVNRLQGPCRCQAVARERGEPECSGS
jgi:hypothetical protein